MNYFLLSLMSTLDSDVHHEHHLFSQTPLLVRVSRIDARAVVTAVKCEDLALGRTKHGPLKAEVAFGPHAVYHTWLGEGANITQELAACGGNRQCGQAVWTGWRMRA